MKKNKIIYWITTGIIGLVSVFSIYKLFSPDYDRLGLPNYLRVEQFPIRIKEWAYAGFGITFISAFVAHYSTGDSLARSLDPHCFPYRISCFKYILSQTQGRIILTH